MKAGVMAALLLFASVGPAQLAPSHIKQAYESARQALRGHCIDWNDPEKPRQNCSFGIDDDKNSAVFLDQEWSLGEWTASYLNEHPDATAHEVEAALGELDSEKEFKAVALAPHTFAVVTRYGEMGNVFVVARQGERFGVAWNIKGASTTGLLAAWSAEAARSDCRPKTKDADWGACGPLFANIDELPKTADGNARFYVNGCYAQMAGATVGAQLSIWEWDGSTARPLLTKHYLYMIDQAVGTRVEGDLLRVRKKEDWRTFFDSSAGEGRQVEWTVRLTPEGVEDLGDKSTMPEMDVVDEVVYRIVKNMPMQGLATRKVVRTLKAAMEEEDEEMAEFRKAAKEKESHGIGDESVASKQNTFRGMLMNTPKTFRVGKRRKLCFSADGIGSFLFTMEKSGGKLRIVDVEDWDGEATGACAEAR